MKFTRMKNAVAAALSMLMVPVCPVAKAEGSLTDSGLSYKETVETISNPGAGYTTTVWANCTPEKTNVYSPTGSLALFFIDIGGFSSGANGTTAEDGTYTEGRDYDFDESFFDAWRLTLDNCRKNGCMVGLRFRYDAGGKADPEPAEFDRVLGHISQIKESGILEDYKDIIALVESGFVGKWGEQHGGKYTSVEYKARLLDTLLDAVPDTIPVTVRTPDTFAQWAGLKRSELTDEKAIEAAGERAKSKRVGMYDDGYMGSDSDLGTYSDREKETDWLSSVAEETYFGGEFSGDIEYAKKFETYLPENAIPEMYKTHLSYINGNIFGLYKDYTFGKYCDVDGVDNSAYYGESVFRFIRDHLGYRFVLRKSELTANVYQGDTVKVRFSVENTGFANPIPHTQGSVILEKDGTYIKAPVDLDCHSWRSGTVTDSEISVKLPDSIRTGDWNIYLKETMGNYGDEIKEMPLRSIHFANEGTWNSALGANLLGTVSVKESPSHGTDNRMYVNGDKDSGSAEYLTSAVGTVIDGEMSYNGEWTEDMLLKKDDIGCAIYAKADESYLYVMSRMPEGAAAPVYNISLKDPDSGENYWLYYASNGFVYFNHDDRSGCECKWNGDMVEFRLPYGIFPVWPGTKLSGIRVFLQDSGSDWKTLGDITSPEYTLKNDLTVYTVDKDIRLAEGDSFTMSVKTPAEGADHQWLKDGKEITGATASEFTIDKADANSSGVYSVRVRTSDGSEKTAVIADVKEVFAADTSVLYGDANCSGDVDVADAVLIMQSISNPGRFGINGSEKSRITEQGRNNGDVSARGDGITVRDALSIQRLLLRIIDRLPENDNSDK